MKKEVALHRATSPITIIKQSTIYPHHCGPQLSNKSMNN